jgi:hypothetical protein
MTKCVEMHINWGFIMKRFISILLLSLLFFITSCGSNNIQNGTDISTEGNVTEAVTTQNNSELNVLYSEFTYEEWKNSINYDEYIEYVKSNDNIKMTIRVYEINDESVIKNTIPIPMTVTIENIGDKDIYQLTSSYCEEPQEKHHHRISVNVKDNYGNNLCDAPEWIEHVAMLGLYKLSPGESFEYLYCLSVGKVYESSIGQDTIARVHEMGYKISFDDMSSHDIYIQLYDYSGYNIEEVNFAGSIGFSYKFEDGYDNNTDSFSIDIDIPVTIVR